MTTTDPNVPGFQADADLVHKAIRTIEAAQLALEGLKRVEGFAPCHEDRPTARALARSFGALCDVLGGLMDARNRLILLATGKVDFDAGPRVDFPLG